MKRPQIRSHPYIQGLNLLLRASGLSRLEGTGYKARLVLDPEMLVQWDQLNPTERYFNLLEAWLRFGHPEMVGERSSPVEQPCSSTCWGPGGACRKEVAGSISANRRRLYFGIGSGLLQTGPDGPVRVRWRVKHSHRPVDALGPCEIERVPFGDAICTLLFTSRFLGIRYRARLSTDEDEDDEEGETEVPRFGAWQPLFRPYFPEWRENLDSRNRSA